jgi:monofunctional biosynthetic peptidoglycan transglycosylase
MPRRGILERLLQNLFWVLLVGILVYLLDLPYVPALRHKNPTRTTLMELRIAQARQAGRRLRTSYFWRDLDQISPYLRQAVLLAEDETFYQHGALDFNEIAEALHRNWEKGRFVYGGSTITQQLARTLYLSPHKNIFRKLKEAEIALWLEHSLKKRRILELYLNVVEWGKGIYGAEAAARHYFNKSAAELTSDEAIALASILPSPRRWSPFSERAFMARRRTHLREEMQQAGYVPVPVSSPTVTEEIPDNPLP